MPNEQDWLETYIAYAKNNEAHPDFHFWTALTVLGTSLRRNVRFTKGYYTVYPNLWSLIVAPSGKKKTTAVQIGYNIVTKMDHVKVLADRGSPEGLAEMLGEKEPDSDVIESQALIYAPELSNFMDKATHMSGLVPLLLRLHDCPERWTYKTRGGGLIPLHNVVISFLGATADELLYECVPPLALKSGFLARFLLIYTGEFEGSVIPFPWKDPELELKVCRGLYELSLLKGEMVMPAVASDWYIQWYFRHKASEGVKSLGKLAAYYERKPDHLLRVGMLLAIARNRRLEFTIDCFKEALDRLEALEPGMEALYREIEVDTEGKDQGKLVEAIKRSGGAIEHTPLFRKFHATMGKDRFKKAAQSLLEARVVLAKRTKSGGLVYGMCAGDLERFS